MNSAVVTIVSKNYLPFARTLMRSIERCNPSYGRFVILADVIDGYFAPADEPFVTILSRDLPIPQNLWVHFKYTILELNTAVKPYALEYLAANYGVTTLIYLDPDIKVYNSLDSLIARLQSSDVLLTPHLLDPIDDKCAPSELDILRSGTYNLGFIALRINGNTRKLLSWWQEKLYDHCYVDLSRGLFTDQRWMDLVPGMFRNVSIVREPGYNVAYWNVKTRTVELGVDGNFTVDGEPLYFFHFSGLNPAAPDNFSKHQNRFTLENIGDVRKLVLDYCADVLSQGYNEARHWPYAFSRFENGIRIPELLRRFVMESPELLERMENPFSCEGYRQYVDYWNTFVPDRAGNISALTRLAEFIYKKRPDLQHHAPEVFGKDLPWFLDWFVCAAQKEYAIDDSLVAPIVAQRKRLIQEREHQAALAAKAEAEARARAEQVQQHEKSEQERALRSLQIQCHIGALSARLGVLLQPHIEEWTNSGKALVDWLNDTPAQTGPTRLAQLIYESRPDLQKTFPDMRHAQREAFLRWLVFHGQVEYQLPHSLVSPFWSALDEYVRSAGTLSRWGKKASLLLDSLRLPVWMLCRTIRSGGAAQNQFSLLIPEVPSDLGPIELPPCSGNGPAVPVQPAPSVQVPPAPAVKRNFGRESALGINIVGYLHAEMGVGESSRCAATAAKSAGLGVSLNNFTIALSRQGDLRLGNVDNQFLYDVNVFTVNADQTDVLFENLEERHHAGRYNIGYWAWELEDFPDCWQSAFSKYDEIWVISAFCQDSISRKSPIPVIRIPCAIDVQLPHPLNRFRFGVPGDKFIFLSFIDLLSIPKRKNIGGVVEAFRRSGVARSGGHLVIKVNNGNIFPDIIEKMRQEFGGPDITIINETWSRPQVNAMIASCDCLVSLHRSEGFGLTMAEAMYLGKPTIATAYSGNMDFTHHDTALLVDYSLTRVGEDAQPYPANSHWAEPNVDVAAEWMDRVRHDSALRSRIGKTGQAYIRNHFSPAVVGGMMKARVAHILGRELSSDRESPLLTRSAHV